MSLGEAFLWNYPYAFVILLFLLCLFSNTIIEKRVRVVFLRLIVLSLLQNLVANLGQWLYAVPGAADACTALTNLSYLIKPVLLYGVAVIAMRDRPRRDRILLLLPIVALAPVFLLSIRFHWVAWHSAADNVFHEGPLYPLSWGILLFYMAAILSSAVRYHHSRTECLFQVAGLSFIALNIVCELFFGGIKGMEQTVIALAMLTYYLNFQSASYAEFRIRAEKDISRARLQAMASQIKPHFIYNSLACIAEICHDGAPEAEKSILTFSSYLRRCFRSLEEDGMVPFTEELESVRCYVELEKLQAAGTLSLREDIRVSDFHIPVLAVETLVENAVKHGIRRKRNGGTVSLRTCRDERGIVISVEDDGVGFDVSAQTSGPEHLGLANARMRLRDQCGAVMRIDSRPGEGTHVEIVIPEVKRT